MKELSIMNCYLYTAVILATAMLVGCDIKQLEHEKGQSNIVKKDAELYQAYLRGNVTQARECLLKDVELLEGAAVLEPIGRAQMLSLACFHLYVLEKRTGHDAASRINLIKANYWSVRKGELLGTTPEKVADDIKKFETESIVQYIDDFDKKHNAGSLPTYLNDISK